MMTVFVRGAELQQGVEYAFRANPAQRGASLSRVTFLRAGRRRGTARVRFEDGEAREVRLQQIIAPWEDAEAVLGSESQEAELERTAQVALEETDELRQWLRGLAGELRSLREERPGTRAGARALARR
jgi:hypothetical protein